MAPKSGGMASLSLGLGDCQCLSPLCSHLLAASVMHTTATRQGGAGMAASMQQVRSPHLSHCGR